MELYIGNIPDDIDDYDLRKFFQIAGAQVSFKIMTRDGGYNKEHRYGLANFESDELARQMIERFNGVAFKDKHVEVREYTHRNYSNERRALNWRDVDWVLLERRNRNRRGLMIQRRTSANEGRAVFSLD